jgi:hypothetical protein
MPFLRGKSREVFLFFYPANFITFDAITVYFS